MSDDLDQDAGRLADIVFLFPDRDVEDDDAPVTTKPRESFCMHKRVALNEELHRVVCRDCDREVDPFAFLMTLSREWERWAAHRKEAERRGRVAAERLEELLRLERNARARLKRVDPQAELTVEKPWGESMRNA